MCVSACQCKSCRKIFNKEAGLDCTKCKHLWSNKDVDYTFGKGVQGCPHHVSMDDPTPAYTPPEFRNPALKSCYQFELLPCPFCGGAAGYMEGTPFGGFHRFFVLCSVCGASTSETAQSRNEAAEVWNRRIADEPWCKENPHVIAHPVVHQPTKAVDSDPPNCGSGVQKPKDGDRTEKFFTAEQIRAMSKEEVRKNYGAILQSMKKW